MLAGAKRFSTLDRKSGFWKVTMHPDGVEKTPLSTGRELWPFTVKPFGLFKAMTTFERLMESVLRGLIYEAYLIYQDDDIIICRTFQEEIDNLRKVFESF
jgi:hypothetical protein